jgi:deoxyribose-phosphate aldolase
MKYIEYAHYDISSNDAELKDIISGAIKYKPNMVSVLPSQLKSIKDIIPPSISIGTVIDFPFGILDIYSKLSAIDNAVKNGCSIVELVCPSYFLCNRKYDKFRSEITEIKKYSDSNDIEIRYILEYRVFTPELLYKIAQILVSYDLYTAYPSTGHLLDNIADNLLACAMIQTKVPKLKLICNGNIWNDTQIKMVNQVNKIYGIKLYSLHSLHRMSVIKKDQN